MLSLFIISEMCKGKSFAKEGRNAPRAFDGPEEGVLPWQFAVAFLGLD
jgi:hypothetical protein